jgi:chemotaxis protein MotB
MSKDGDSGRWLVSYSDFISCTFALFVVLYAMGRTDLAKYKEMSESFRQAFSGGPAQVIDPGINQGGFGTGDSSPAPITFDDMPTRMTDSLDVASRMSTVMNAHNMEGDVSVQNNIEGLLISISEQLLFNPGTSDLKDTAYPVLDSLAGMLLTIDNDIRVEGHTDDTPPVDPAYASNWELSVTRAVRVVNYLIEVGVAPERLTASGKSEYSPVFPNDKEEYRMYNSRADIIIIYPIESEILNLDFDLFGSSGFDAGIEAPGR